MGHLLKKEWSHVVEYNADDGQGDVNAVEMVNTKWMFF